MEFSFGINISMGDYAAPGPSPHILVVRNSAGTNYPVPSAILDSTGTSFSVTNTVLNSAGTPYNVI